jgi:Na+-translocating ferredoxin:NAD+ oxidoreductase RnfG subunit
MKNSAKIGLIVALFSILGAGTLIKAVHATQIPNLVESVKSASIKAIAPSHQEKEDSDDDDDDETDDDGQK